MLSKIDFNYKIIWQQFLRILSSTKKYLKRIPVDQNNWMQPNTKS